MSTFLRNITASIRTLTAQCQGYGIFMVQFLADATALILSGLKRPGPFLFVFVLRVRLIFLCCLYLFIVLFTLFATWLLTQHFNKQGINNDYYIVFINEPCSVIKYFIYLRFACIKIYHSINSSDDCALMYLTLNIGTAVANFMKLSIRKCSLLRS